MVVLDIIHDCVSFQACSSNSNSNSRQQQQVAAAEGSMKIAETMCPVSTRAVSTHACLGHRGSARPPYQHVIADQVLPGCSWGRQHRMGATVAFWPERPPKRLAEMEWLCPEPPRSSSKHPSPARAALQTICEMIKVTISVLSLEAWHGSRTQRQQG